MFNFQMVPTVSWDGNAIAWANYGVAAIQWSIGFLTLVTGQGHVTRGGYCPIGTGTMPRLYVPTNNGTLGV